MIEKNTERVNWIDCAKGITICLVIVGHTVHRGSPILEDAVRGAIFSFHMPLFFVLSAVTTRFSTSSDQLVLKSEKAFRKLIIPAVSTYLFLVVVNVVRYGIEGGKREYLTKIVNTLVYSSGVGVKNIDAPALGSLWFLVVLFSAKVLLDYMHLRLSKKTYIGLCGILSIAGICFGKIQWLPLSFDVVLAVIPFFLFGDCYKKHVNKEPSFARLVIAFIVWSSLLIAIHKYSGHYLELATREYPLAPFCYLDACSGIMFMIQLSKYIDRIHVISKLCATLGRHSMIIYLVHAIDYQYSWIWGGNNSNIWVIIALRILADLIIAFAVVSLLSLFKKRGGANE